MNLKLAVLGAGLLSLVASCSSGPIKKNKDGVTVTLQQNQPNDARLVRLTVLGEKIIRVSATPDNKFVDEESLVVLPIENNTPFEIIETDSNVTVATMSLRASVNLNDGRVTFADSTGHVIAREDVDGRSFSPIEVEGKKGYTVSQRFESINDEEAIYGLGQHQADEFNYKGKNEELFQ